METKPTAAEASKGQKILIDTTFLFDQYARRGIGRSGRETIKRLVQFIIENRNLELHLLGFNTLESNLAQLEISPFIIDEIKEKINFHSVGEAVPSGVRNITRWNKWYGELINIVKPDLFFAAHLERGLPTASIFKRNLKYIPKTVVLVPDAIQLSMKGFRYSSKGLLVSKIKEYFYKVMWDGVRNADLIITCSNFSKGDIVNNGKVESDKVKVVYLGISENFYKGNLDLNQEEIEQILEIYSVKNKKYYFYDTGVEANKGSYELLYILSKLKDIKDAPSHIVITGGDFKRGMGDEIVPITHIGIQFLNKAKKLGVIDMIITTGKISDEHLIVLLQNASFYINLSKYEGFHFGPVQAMAAEVPAIAGNTSCTPEITNGGTYLVNLENLDKAVKEIVKFLQDKNLQDQYIKKGKEVVKNYTWEKSAGGTWKLLEDLLNS